MKCDRKFIEVKRFIADKHVGEFSFITVLAFALIGSIIQDENPSKTKNKHRIPVLILTQFFLDVNFPIEILHKMKKMI